MRLAQYSDITRPIVCIAAPREPLTDWWADVQREKVQVMFSCELTLMKGEIHVTRVSFSTVSHWG